MLTIMSAIQCEGPIVPPTASSFTDRIVPILTKLKNSSRTSNLPPAVGVHGTKSACHIGLLFPTMALLSTIVQDLFRKT
jgi:hypothetical protein